MPRISEFNGIVIYMYWDDHPPPHFHAECGDDEAGFDIHTGEILWGALPRPKVRRVRRWLAKHRDELLLDWDLVMKKQTPNPIQPLP